MFIMLCLIKIKDMKLAWRKLYGPMGLAIFAIMALIAYLRIPHANIWVTPLAWYGYILFVDSLVYKRKNTSLLMTNTKEFFIMLPSSIGLWCIFELHNLLFHSWKYIGLPQNKFVTVFGFAISFATILPAIYETFDFLKSRNFFNVKISPRSYSKLRLILEICLGIALIATATFTPSIYTGPLIWLGYLFLFVPLNYLIGAPSVLKEREKGKISDILNLLIAGYICGVVWEFLNYKAGAKWIYRVPYFQNIKLFEMPIIGFLGFGPFAVTFIEMYNFIRFLPKIYSLYVYRIFKIDKVFLTPTGKRLAYAVYLRYNKNKHNP